MERRADCAPVACQPWYASAPLRTPGGEPFGPTSLSGKPAPLPPMSLPLAPPPAGPHASRPPTGRPPVGGRGGWLGAPSLPSGRLFGGGGGGGSGQDLPAAPLPSPSRLHPVQLHRRPPAGVPGGGYGAAPAAGDSGAAAAARDNTLPPLSPASPVKLEAHTVARTGSGVEGVVSGWAAAAAEVRALTPAVASSGRGDGPGGTGSGRRDDSDGADAEALLFGAPRGGAPSSGAATETDDDDGRGEDSPATAAAAAAGGTPPPAAASRADKDGPPLGPLEIRRRRAARNRASAGRSRVKKKAAAAALEESLTGARAENGRLKERMAQLLAARAQLLARQAELPPLEGGGEEQVGAPADGGGAAPRAVDGALRHCPADGLGALG